MAGRGPISSLAQVPLAQSQAQAGPHLALVPGEDAPLMALDLPLGLRGPARYEVARQTLLLQLGLPAEALEIRPFEPDAQLWSRVFVVDRTQAQVWRRAPRGKAALAVLPDYLALPAAPGVWTLDLRDGRVRARLGVTDGFSAELGLAAVQLALARAEAAPVAVLCPGDGAPDLTRELADALDGLPVFTAPEALAAAGHPLPRPLSRAALRRSDLARDPALAGAGRGARWRGPMMLLAASLAMLTLADVLQTRRAEAEVQQVQAATTALVRQHFVPTGPLLDIRAQVARQVAARLQAAPSGPARSAAPLELIRRAAPALAASDARLRSLAFAGAGPLTAEVDAPDFTGMEALVAALESSGFAPRVVDAVAAENGSVAARIALVAAP